MCKNFLKKNLQFLIIVTFFLNFIFHGTNLNSRVIQEQETLHYEVTVILKLIQVYVTDKKGNPVTDLTQSDFEIYDNGKLKPIAHFEKHILSAPEKEVRPTKTPSKMNRKFFLLFDFAFNTPAGVMRAKKAALHFIDTQLFPSDEVGVLSYSTKKGLTMHEYLTTDHQRVREIVESFGVKEVLGRAEELEDIYSGAIEQIEPEDIKTREYETQIDREIERMKSNVRLFQKEVYKQEVSNFCLEIEKLAKVFRYIPGYKQVILFSRGIADFILYGKGIYGKLRTEEDILFAKPRYFEAVYGDAGLREKYEKMAKELRASNSPLYAINVESQKLRMHPESRVMMGIHSLKRLSKVTGGKYFSNTMDYKKIMEEIQNLTSTYYVLGYYIDEKWDGKYHKIKVKVKRKGCKVYGQGGYFNPKPFTKYTKFEKLLHLIDLALSERPHFQEPLKFPLIALPYSTKEKSNILILTKIPSEKIRKISGRKMEIVTLIFDSKNNIVEFKRSELNTSKTAKNNLYYYTFSSLSPGQYNCRIVIRNLETGKGAVASSSVTIPEKPDSGLKLYPPLLLTPKKNAYYLKSEKERLSLSDIYPFNSTQYSPVVRELSPQTSKLLAVVRCLVINISHPEIKISGYLIQLSSGKRTPLSISVLSQYKGQNSQVFLIEIPIGNLKSGKYFLYLFADEMSNKLRATTNTTFEIK